MCECVCFYYIYDTWQFKQIQAFVAETFYKIKGQVKWHSIFIFNILLLPPPPFPVTHEVREERVDFTWHRYIIYIYKANILEEHVEVITSSLSCMPHSCTLPVSPCTPER